MLFADEPTTWPDGRQPSVLHVLLLFGGVPLLITAVIVLLVMAPSLARGRRSTSGPRSGASEWFGDPEARESIAAGDGQFHLPSSGRRIALGAPPAEPTARAASGATGAHATAVGASATGSARGGTLPGSTGGATVAGSTGGATVAGSTGGATVAGSAGGGTFPGGTGGATVAADTGNADVETDTGGASVRW